MAGPTRFELATSGVTGRRSNQLNYDPALTKYYNFKNHKTKHLGALVGGTGLEPVTAGV